MSSQKAALAALYKTGNFDNTVLNIDSINNVKSCFNGGSLKRNAALDNVLADIGKTLLKYLGASKITWDVIKLATRLRVHKLAQKNKDSPAMKQLLKNSIFNSAMSKETYKSTTKHLEKLIEERFN